MGEKRFKSRKIYVKDMNGETVRVFDSLKDAAEVYGVSSSTISYWANNGCIKDGYSFEYDPGEEEAKLFGGNPKKPKKAYTSWNSRLIRLPLIRQFPTLTASR